MPHFLTCRRIAFCVITLVLLLGLSIPSLLAQEATPTASPTETILPTLTPSLTASPTETASPLPTLTPTPSLTPMPTESATATVPPTITLEQLPTELPETTDEPTTVPSAEITEEVVGTATNETATLPPEMTPEVTEDVVASATSLPTDAPLPPETEMFPLFSTNFDGGDLDAWSEDGDWSFVSHENGLALQVFDSESLLRLNQGPFYNLAVEMLVLPTNGSALLHLRQSEVGDYSVSLDAQGYVSLSRAGIPLRSVAVDPLAPGEWYHLRFSAIEGALRVAVNGVEVMVVLDTMPLPPGTAAISGTFATLADDVTPVPPMQTLLVDNFRLWIPTTEMPTSTSTPQPTLEPTPVTPSLTPSTTSMPISPTADTVNSGSAQPPEWEQESGGNVRSSIMAAESFDEPHYLEIVEDFDEGDLEPWQLPGSATVSGIPAGEVTGFWGSTRAVAQISSPGIQQLEVQVDFELSEDPQKTYTVIWLSYWRWYFIDPLSMIEMHEHQAIYRDVNGSPIYTSAVCEFEPFNDDSDDCWVGPFPIEGVHSITIIHRTAAPVNIASSGDRYGIAIDDIIVTTDEMVYPPTPTPSASPTATSTPTATPDPCDFRPLDELALIDAIDAANGNGLLNTTICLQEWQTYVLDDYVHDYAMNKYGVSADNGMPPITGNVTLVGSDSAIVRDSSAAPFRIFYVDTAGVLHLSGVTVSEGNAENLSGGGIYNLGTVTMEDSVISDNHAWEHGGGIYNAGTLTITGSEIRSNDASVGGGIRNEGTGTVEIIDSVITENYASGYGGGVDNYLGTVTISWTRVSDNQAGFGGGLDNYLGEMHVTNSVLENNEAFTASGGALQSDTAIAGGMTMGDSCIQNNISTDGIATHNFSAEVLDATDNWWGDPSGPTHSTNPAGYGDTISDNVDYIPFLTESNCDQTIPELTCTAQNATAASYPVHQSPGALSPVIGMLSDQTITITGQALGWYQIIGFEPYPDISPDATGWIEGDLLLLSDTCADNDIPVCQPAPAPQSLSNSDFTLNAVTTLTNACYYQQLPPTNWNLIEVTTTENVIAQDDVCSLAEAILNTNGDESDLGCDLVYDSAISGDAKVIRLQEEAIYNIAEHVATNNQNGLPVIQSNVIIESATESDATIARTGQQPFRLFEVAPDAQLELRHIVVTRGQAESGGGILNAGTLILSSSSVEQNRATSNGGGIYSTGDLQVTGSSIRENRAEYDGGGVFNTGSLDITDSKIERNVGAWGRGGGIFNAATDENATIDNSCIVFNTSEHGGGIQNDSTNKVIADNVWWGHPEGPTITEEDGSVIGFGLGDVVSAKVSAWDYQPAPALDGCIEYPDIFRPTGPKAKEFHDKWGEPGMAAEIYVRVRQVTEEDPPLEELFAFILDYTGTLAAGENVLADTAEAVGRQYHRFVSGSTKCVEDINNLQIQEDIRLDPGTGLGTGFLCFLGATEWYGENLSQEEQVYRFIEFMNNPNPNKTTLMKYAGMVLDPDQRVNENIDPSCRQWEIEQSACPYSWGNYKMWGATTQGRINTDPTHQVDDEDTLRANGYHMSPDYFSTIGGAEKGIIWRFAYISNKETASKEVPRGFDGDDAFILTLDQRDTFFCPSFEEYHEQIAKGVSPFEVNRLWITYSSKKQSYFPLCRSGSWVGEWFNKEENIYWSPPEFAGNQTQ